MCHSMVDGGIQCSCAPFLCICKHIKGIQMDVVEDMKKMGVGVNVDLFCSSLE